MLETHEKCAIRALWLAVIRQAIEDHALWREVQAGRKTNTPDKKTVVYKTGYAWIEGGGPDFQAVCNMVDIDPARVQTAASTRQIQGTNF